MTTMTFEDLKLLPGAPIQVDLHLKDEVKREPCTLIGYVINRCIIVSAPEIEDLSVIRTGGLVEISLYSTAIDCSVLFSVQVQVVLEQPFPVLFLGFPAFLAKDEARKELRLSTNLVANVKTHLGQFPALIVDLSASGCKLSSTEFLGDVGSPFMMATKLVMNSGEVVIKLRCEIKALLAKSGTNSEEFMFGVAFVDLTTENITLLRSYIEELSA